MTMTASLLSAFHSAALAGLFVFPLCSFGFLIAAAAPDGLGDEERRWRFICLGICILAILACAFVYGGTT